MREVSAQILAAGTASYSEGELSKTATGTPGRSLSRGQEGHSTGGSGGYHSSGSRGTSQGGRGSGESRKSGHSAESDAGVVRQANVFIRTKSDSGKRLTDQEILRQIKVKNLDTGAEMDLQTAEEQLPQSINPLSLQIMRLTGEYTGTGSRYGPDTGGTDSDNDSMASSVEFELGLGKKKSHFWQAARQCHQIGKECCQRPWVAHRAGKKATKSGGEGGRETW